MISYKPYKNIRICNGKSYYFNKHGILESEQHGMEWVSSNDLREAFNYSEIKIYAPKNKNVYSWLRLCISKLNTGDSIDTLETLIKSTNIGVLFSNEIDRFVTKIGTPNYERFPENKNKKTFDFIRVDVNVLSNIDGRKEYIVKHHDEICNMVLDKIKSSYRFKKFGVPINFLNLEKATFIPRISVIEFLFSLKQIENII